MPICCLESTQGGAPERREEVSDHIGFVPHWRSRQSHFYLSGVSYLHVDVNKQTETFQIVYGADGIGHDFFSSPPN